MMQTETINYPPQRIAPHPWRITRGRSIFDTLLQVVLWAVAFSLPLEGALQYYVGGSRSLAFYLSIVAFALAVLRLPLVLSNLMRSSGIWLLFVAYAWSFALYYMFPQEDGSEIQLLLQLFALATMYLYLADDPKQRERLIWGYWIGWTLLVIWSIYAYQSGNFNLYQRAGVVRAKDIAGYSSNEHARQVAAGMLVSLILALRTHNRSLRVSLIASLIGSSIALLLTNSKGGTFSLFITLALWLVASTRFSAISLRKLLKSGLLILVVSTGIFYIFTESELGSSLARSYGVRVTGFLEGNYSSRDVLLEEGLEAASGNLMGVGQGNSLAVLEQMFGSRKDPHNYYVRVLLEAGLPGFILFAIGLFFIIRRGWDWVRASHDSVYFWPMVFFLIAALSGRDFHFKVCWFFLAMNALTPLGENKRPALPITRRRMVEKLPYESPEHYTVVLE